MSRSRDLSNLITNALPSYLAYGQFNGNSAQTFAGNAFTKVTLNETLDAALKFGGIKFYQILSDLFKILNFIFSQ
jgi:hypothetical protein